LASSGSVEGTSVIVENKLDDWVPGATEETAEKDETGVDVVVVVEDAVSFSFSSAAR
jgi:hypothetical protein